MSFSVNSLGNNGHLGNQMFQYAFAKSMSIKHSRSFCIAPNEVFGKFYYQKLFSNIDECFDINCDRKITDYLSVKERCFEFDENLFENPPEKDIDFVGYWQSERYFKHIENELRKDFTFVSDILDPCKDFMSSFGSVIGVHIRRNDFLKNENHPVQNNSYYQKALLEFDQDLPVLVFSDDIEWCKEQSIFSDDRFMISESEDAYADLCLMSMCDHHIICNSTYSWWGAWLADSKNVIAPKKWFGGDNINLNTKDLYLLHWILL